MTVVVHSLISAVYVGMVHGVCAYIIVVIHPLIQGSMWVWYMVYYSGCTPTYSGVYGGIIHGVYPLIEGSKWVWYMVYVPK